MSLEKVKRRRKRNTRIIIYATRPHVIIRNYKLPVCVAGVEERFETRLILIVLKAVQFRERNSTIGVIVQVSEHPPDLGQATGGKVSFVHRQRQNRSLQSIRGYRAAAPPRRRAAAPPRRRARSSQLHICNNRTFGLDALTTVFSVCHNDGKPIEQSVSHCRSWRGWTVGDTRRRLGTRDGLEGRWIILLDLVAHRVLVVVFARSAASLFVIKLNN